MGHKYGLRFSHVSDEAIHQALVSQPTFYARSSDYGYCTDGFETKNADAYLFVALENRVGHQPHPDIEVVIEPYGVCVNCFTYIDEFEKSLEREFGVLESML